jgi:leucyl/phenylalanyl-tRNA--protein transferase
MPYLLSDDLVFPDPRNSWEDNQGLIAIGGDLSPERLILAYQHGIFPWYSEHDPILWWCPEPRTVLYLDEFKVSRSLMKSIRNKGYDVYLNRDFEAVINACAELRASQEGTWITDEMQDAYIELHRLGLAHCVSVYKDNNLVGGLYGPSLGPFFFGESMFSSATDASKVALYYLVHYLKTKDFKLIDCQINNDHLVSLGAREISRDKFLNLLDNYVHNPQPNMWQPRQLTG